MKGKCRGCIIEERDIKHIEELNEIKVTRMNHKNGTNCRSFLDYLNGKTCLHSNHWYEEEISWFLCDKHYEIYKKHKTD